MVSFSLRRGLSSLSLFTAAALLFGRVSADCASYGIDFQGGGDYFINSTSPEQFTFVSQFEGCQNDVAYVMLVDPSGDELDCSTVPLQPDNTDQMSTCPITKSQMASGTWLILFFSNNGGDQFSGQREISLTCGQPQTVTSTPTAWFQTNLTIVQTSTTTQTYTENSTIGPLSTVVQAARTATFWKTAYPRPTTTTTTSTNTRTRVTGTTKIFTKTTITKNPTCTVPPRAPRPDPPCQYTPRNPKYAQIANRYRNKKKGGKREADDEVSQENAAIIQRRRTLRERKGEMVALEKRAPDQAIVTVMDPVPINMTSTVECYSIETEFANITTTATVTLPPETIFSGLAVVKKTTTMPQKTVTRTKRAYTTQYTRITIAATFTYYTVVTPTASASSCKAHGGHFGRVDLR